LNEIKRKLIHDLVKEETTVFLRGVREFAGFDLETASSRLNYASPARLREYESGEVAVPVAEVLRILVAYELPCDVFTAFALHVQRRIRSQGL
jgi:hypothetical protein